VFSETVSKNDRLYATGAERRRNVADATAAKKRGRPKAFPDELMKLYEAGGLFLDVGSERQRQNIAYRMRAAGLLKDDPERFGWLYDLRAGQRGEKKAWKPTILSELGRIRDDEELKEVASEVCKLRPKTRDAVSMIRRYRTGKTAPVDVLGLTLRITDAIDEYVASHPDTTWRQVKEALKDAYDTVEACELRGSA
jgi:hypothetical protein